MVKIIIGFGIFKLNKRVVLGIIIKKTLKKNILSINFVEKDFPEISHQYLDSSKMTNLTGWKPKTNLKSGLQKSIKKYKEIL